MRAKARYVVCMADGDILKIMSADLENARACK